MMASSTLERPAIYISLMQATPAEYARWVEIGAEEEGVPCRLVEIEGKDLIERAYQAATASPLKIGVAVSNDAVVLHEFHMPPHQPVLVFDLDNNPQRACRLMGANAARFFVRRPLYLTTVTDTPQQSPAAAENPQNLSPTEVKQVVTLVLLILQKLRERGAL
jgi:hypothetical protein